MKAKSVSGVPFPVKLNNLNHYKLPLLGRKKKKIHTKNPFKTKIYYIPDDTVMSVKCLDGFLIIKLTKNDIPHEIIRADLSRKRIYECRPEDFRYFLNLEVLDVSENQIKLEDLMSFPSLKTLKICANNIRDISLDVDNKFDRLISLDLSFNYLTTQAIQGLEYLPELQKLHLVNNELQELPEDMSRFYKLQDLDVSDNNFSSKLKPQELWYSLGVIPNLKKLNISKNFLRGIHVGKLQIGHFNKLEHFDFSYNMAENQHNLICARNFQNLQVIIVTGNPFGVMKEHQGLEMEVHARTGAILINDEIEKPYLKKPKLKKPPIRYEQLKRVEDDIFRLPLIEEKQTDQDIIDENNGETMFVTENVQPGKSKQHHQSPIVKPQTYEEFSRIAGEVLGDGKDYETQPNKPLHDLATAYSKLKSVLNKPEQPDYDDFNEPNYMKPTVSIPRYKYVTNDEVQEPSSIQRNNKQTDNRSIDDNDEFDLQLVQ